MAVSIITRLPQTEECNKNLSFTFSEVTLVGQALEQVD